MEFVKKHFATVFVLVCAVIAAGVFAFLGSSGEPTPVRTENTIMHSVSPDEFEALGRSGEYTVIDIRTPEEIAKGKVFADALEIDFYEPDFRTELSKLDRDGKYLIYCNSGNRTAETKSMMRWLGFKEMIDLEGGKVAWEESGRPLELFAEGVESESGIPENEVVVEEPVEKPIEEGVGEAAGNEEGDFIACTMDAKQCPDGSYVGRVAPDCEFAPCS